MFGQRLFGKEHALNIDKEKKMAENPIFSWLLCSTYNS